MLRERKPTVGVGTPSLVIPIESVAARSRRSVAGVVVMLQHGHHALRYDRHCQVAGVTPPGLGTRRGRPDDGSC